jgi:hypothetical protein
LRKPLDRFIGGIARRDAVPFGTPLRFASSRHRDLCADESDPPVLGGIKETLVQ